MQPQIIFPLVLVAILIFLACRFAAKCYWEAEDLRRELKNEQARNRNLQNENNFLKDENMLLHIANEQQRGYVGELEEFIEDMESFHPVHITNKTIKELAIGN